MSLLQQLLCLILSSDLLLLSSANSITFSLSRVPPPSTNPLENLKYDVAASRARVHHLIKCPNDVHLPLYPHSYGEYTVNLSFGTPPQTVSLILDTGSDLVWVPCTGHYNCTSNCPKHIATFIPEFSSSYKNVTCKQCKSLTYGLHCHKDNTCWYVIEYGLGNTTGRLLSETLTIPGLSVHNFIVGCSVSSDYLPEGIAGFSRGRASLPAQLGLTSFSYCMTYDTTGSSDLVLTRGGGKGRAGNYTPFVPNPSVDQVGYYVSLQSISIGRVNVQVPTKYVSPNAKGIGGTIVDSGTTLTLMSAPVFDLVFNETVKQVGKTYKRSKKTEHDTGLKLCYNVGKNKLINLPQFTFHFQGNAEMVLPDNCFAYTTESVICMTIVNFDDLADWGELGPTIILGNFQQQDYYMEYDLENNRLGMRQQKCK